MKAFEARPLASTAAAAGLALLGSMVVCAFGCATAPVKAPESPVYFPAPPDPPRIQYLTSFTGRTDVEEQSAFDRFLVGEKANVKVDKPYGVAVHDGKIYVCDTNASVAVFDLKNQRLGSLEGAIGPGTLRQPVNITIDPRGTKYVADPGRGQIVVFDRSDKYVKAYGTQGAWRPVDAVPFENDLYVADAANGLVKVFDLASGDLLRTIGDKGDPSERLDRPTNLAMDGEGFLYVTDVGRFQVVKFDRDGHFQATFGAIGDTGGHFARPKGIAVDREGRLFAVDSSFNNVQVFNKDGRLLMFFGGGGEKRGDFLLPAKVTLDYDNLKYFEKYVEPTFRAKYLIFVTSQFGARRVSVFAAGRQKFADYPTDDEVLKAIEERRKKELEKAVPLPPDKPAEPPAAKPPAS